MNIPTATAGHSRQTLKPFENHIPLIQSPGFGAWECASLGYLWAECNQ